MDAAATLLRMVEEHRQGIGDAAPDVATSSDDYARRFARPVGEWFLSVQEQACLDLVRPWRGGSVLDVGGGHAQVAVPLAREGYAVTVLGSTPGGPASRWRSRRAASSSSRMRTGASTWSWRFGCCRTWWRGVGSWASCAA